MKPATLVSIICMLAFTTSTIVWMWDIKKDTMNAIQKGVQAASESKIQEQIDKLEAVIETFRSADSREKIARGVDFLRDKMTKKDKDKD